MSQDCITGPIPTIPPFSKLIESYCELTNPPGGTEPGGGIDPNVPFTWTAGDYDVTIGQHDDGIVHKTISYQIAGGTLPAEKAFGTALFGPNVFNAELVLVDPAETNYVNQYRGLGFKPVGGAPPGLVNVETMSFDPVSGDTHWNVNAGSFTSNVDGATGDVDVFAAGQNHGLGAHYTSSTGDTLARLGEGVRVEYTSSSSKVDVYLTPTAAGAPTLGHIYIENLETYADDAAALAGGVPQNAMYKRPDGSLAVKL